MTSSNPMNISINGMDNYCDEKCAYSFKYQISNTCTATNYGTYIHLNYIDSGNVAPVTFNSNTYNVDNIEIYSPSLHYFNGKAVDGEIIITHKATSVGMPLVVCIPIIVGGRQLSSGSQIISDIINDVVAQPLKQGEPAMNIKLNDYTLNSIVPITPFFYYTGSNDYNIIVYGLNTGISVDQSVITGLQTIISPVSNVIYPSVDYFYMNKTGPSNNRNVGDEIYIDCQPTGNSEETTDVTFDKNPIVNNIGSMFNIQIIIFIIAAFIFVFLIMMIHKFLAYLTDGKVGEGVSKLMKGTKKT